ncbi:CCR4-NOT transcription complex subunit 6, partial [Phenoliferia sp. Uapishka_3]
PPHPSSNGSPFPPHPSANGGSPFTPHPSVNGGSSASNGGAGGGVVTAHWQQQLSFASISRQASSPHHHARAAHLAARGHPTSAITITDPNRPSKPLSYGPSSIFQHRKEPSGSGGIMRPESTGPEVVDRLDSMRSSSVTSNRTTTSSIKELTSSPPTLNGDTAATTTDGKDSWTTIDMGGMNLKNVSPELFRYTFLTTLYIPHNVLTSLPGSISRLVNLTLLDASSNKLSSLPPELGLLTHLRDLFLFDNHLTSLPAELGTLHLLDTLGIEGNPLPETMRSLLEKEGTTALISYLRDSCPVPLPPPEREWVPIEPDQLPTLLARPPDANFTLMCYNILCEHMATPQMYGYTPSWALSWDYRKELILQEILNSNSDIICLQEVDAEQYEEYFLENLSAQGYEGVHYPRSRARTMSGDEKRHVDGCATFYKPATFAMVEQQVIEFNQIALRRPDFKKTEDVFNRVMTRDHVAVVTLLEHRDSGARLIVANAHIFWDHDFRDVKLVQVAMLMDELAKISNDFAKLPPRLNLAEGFDAAPSYSNGSKIPTIVCGDFNSVSDSGVLEFLGRGSVSKDHSDFMNHTYGNYTSEGIAHRLALKSAYSHLNELPFTNFTPGFQGVIDYIFYTTNSLGVSGLLGEVDREYLSSSVGFPSAHFPSDHLSIMAEMKFK